MPLVTSTEMFKKAYDGGYAIGAFNVNNMEIVQGITEACQEEHAPVIPDILRYAEYLLNVVFTRADAIIQITAPITTSI